VSVLLIAFLPMLKVITDPLVGFLSLGLILVALGGADGAAGPHPRSARRGRRGQPRLRGRALGGDRAGQPRARGAGGVAPRDSVADPRVARCAPRDMGSAVGRSAVRPGDGDRRDRQHRERDRRRRPLPHAGHPADRGAGDDPRGPLRGRGPEHALRGASGVQGDGRAGRVHAGNRAPDRPRGDGRCRIDPRRPGAGSGGRPYPHLRRARDHGAGLPRDAAASRSGGRPRVRADDRGRS
jgi:hypothetical protein